MSDVTRILSKIESGDQQAPSALLPLVYHELRNLADARRGNLVANQAAEANAFALPRREEMARMLRRDIDFVCEPWRQHAQQNSGNQAILARHPDFLRSVDSNGQRIDFHDLRHTCGAWLALAGVHVKTIQSVRRHKDVKLTLDTDGHLFRSMEEEALAKMDLMIRGTAPEATLPLFGEGI